MLLHHGKHGRTTHLKQGRASSETSIPFRMLQSYIKQVLPRVAPPLTALALSLSRSFRLRLSASSISPIGPELFYILKQWLTAVGSASHASYTSGGPQLRHG